MKFLFRWAFRLFLVFVVLVVALVLLKDSALKAYVEHRIRSETGLDVRIGKLEAGLFNSTLTIENLKLYNTAEFGGSPLIDLPELHLEGDGSFLASRRLHFKLVRLAVHEINVVESQNGRTNIVGVLASLDKLTSTNRPTETPRDWEFDGIDTLNLTLGKLKYFSMKKLGQATEFDLGLNNQIVTNVKSLNELSSVVMTAILQKGITILGDPVSSAAAHKKSEITGKQPHRK